MDLTMDLTLYRDGEQAWYTAGRFHDDRSVARSVQHAIALARGHPSEAWMQDWLETWGR